MCSEIVSEYETKQETIKELAGSMTWLAIAEKSEFLGGSGRKYVLAHIVIRVAIYMTTCVGYLRSQTSHHTKILKKKGAARVWNRNDSFRGLKGRIELTFRRYFPANLDGRILSWPSFSFRYATETH
ncbi:hypothetical protein BDU57DRAFT_267034 [Ampelomyces quisqualis]|uniref:Uncharacterized protein n=1 Tax=Ampelomyces quisqualis TaxID=50730 RepID=A0A6A5QIP5_AMPQU|nr:hypothetical protein BDU57DRAFT_267034 [Ampelomyces quisqualis]